MYYSNIVCVVVPKFSDRSPRGGRCRRGRLGVSGLSRSGGRIGREELSRTQGGTGAGVLRQGVVELYDGVVAAGLDVLDAEAGVVGLVVDLTQRTRT